MATERDDSMAAFPRIGYDYAIRGEHRHVDGQPGMSLWQWYAGQALIGLLSSGGCNDESAAARAVKIADAMIKETT